MRFTLLSIILMDVLGETDVYMYFNRFREMCLQNISSRESIFKARYNMYCNQMKFHLRGEFYYLAGKWKKQSVSVLNNILLLMVFIQRLSNHSNQSNLPCAPFKFMKISALLSNFNLSLSCKRLNINCLSIVKDWFITCAVTCYFAFYLSTSILGKGTMYHHAKIKKEKCYM